MCQSSVFLFKICQCKKNWILFYSTQKINHFKTKKRQLYCKINKGFPVLNDNLMNDIRRNATNHKICFVFYI